MQSPVANFTYLSFAQTLHYVELYMHVEQAASHLLHLFILFSDVEKLPSNLSQSSLLIHDPSGLTCKPLAHFTHVSFLPLQVSH